MPWQNQGGGPWGSGGGGGQGPWGGRGGGSGGGGGGGGGSTPPDLEELLRRSQDRMRRLMPGGFGSGKGVALVVAAAVLVWLATGFYRVESEEQGVALVFGQFWRQTDPGLHYNLPAPIGEVVTPAVQRVNRVEVGFRGTAAAVQRRGATQRQVQQESLMLTGDENIIDVQFVVLWRIADASKFLFNVRNAEQTVKAAAESSMREIIGKNEFEYARTVGRGAVTEQAKALTQTILDSYGAGIVVAGIEIQEVDPPSAVIDAFRDVQAAAADRERAINEATAYHNEITQRAEGEASHVVAASEAYKEEKVAKARGESDRFLSVFEQYQQDKDVTRRRMYLETMEEVMNSMDKVLVDSEGTGGSGVVPYLPLDRLTQPRPAADPAASQEAGR